MLPVSKRRFARDWPSSDGACHGADLVRRRAGIQAPYIDVSVSWRGWMDLAPHQLYAPDWTTATVLPSRRLRSAISALLVILKDSP